MLNPKKYSPRNFEVIDTTLREGIQSPLLADVGKYHLSSGERIDLTLNLMKYGVRFLEVFSPIVNEKEEGHLALLIKARDGFYKETGHSVFILAHVRCHPSDVEMAIKSGVDGLNFYMGTSEESQNYNHGKKIDEIINTLRPLLSEIRKNHPDLLLRFSGEDAFRTPLEDLYEVYDSVVDLVDRLGTPDTVGIATPAQVEARVLALKKRYPKTPLEGHFHNDRGYSLINTVTAVKAGMQYIQTSVMGIGERSGITSLTGLLCNLYLDDPKSIEGFSLEQSYPLNVFLSSVVGIQVPTTEPVSLTNRTHSAGPHTSAVIKNSSAYEGHDLSVFGVNDRRLLLGPLSGRHIIKYYLTNVLNFLNVTDEIANDIASEFKLKTGEIKSGKTPTQFLEQLAATHKLQKLSKPVSHRENLG
ncbi:MAG: pyruvate carboxyltransferase [Candidatus Shapirobacteria bacterium]|jgi:homocitrate synthase